MLIIYLGKELGENVFAGWALLEQAGEGESETHVTRRHSSPN